MTTLEFNNKPYRADLLTDELIAAGLNPTAFIVSSSGQVVWVECEADAVATVMQVAAAHDATRLTPFEQKMLMRQQMAQRAQAAANSLPYFKATSDELWSAIEKGKPDVEAAEMDTLHEAFSTQMAAEPSWEASHEFVRELWYIAFRPEHPLHATHGDKALDLISWYSFNVVASLTAFLGSQNEK
jgi:hypothetical protein